MQSMLQYNYHFGKGFDMPMRRWSTLTLIVPLLISMTACGTDNSGVQTASEEVTEEELVIHDTHSDDGRNVVGISMPSQSLERWNRDGLFLKQGFEEAGYEVLLSYGNDLIDEQINGIEDMIDQGADLLIITPIDASSLESVVKKAAEAAIPVLSYDRLILRSPYIDYYVSFDNYSVGVLQGEFIRDQLDLDHAGNHTYNIEFVSGDPADNNAQFFYSGAYDVLSPYIDAGTLIVPSGQTEFFQTATSSWSRELAQERFENILNSYYTGDQTLHAVCCSNDATALGARQAIDVDYQGTNEIVITGQDGDEPNLKNILDGKQSMTVYKPLTNESVVTLYLALSILSGNTPGAELIQNSNWDFECTFDTTSYDNGKKIVSSYLLTPLVITKENMQEELVEKGYYTTDEQGYLHAIK